MVERPMDSPKQSRPSYGLDPPSEQPCSAESAKVMPVASSVNSQPSCAAGKSALTPQEDFILSLAGAKIIHPKYNYSAQSVSKNLREHDELLADEACAADERADAAIGRAATIAQWQEELSVLHDDWVKSEQDKIAKQKLNIDPSTYKAEDEKMKRYQASISKAEDMVAHFELASKAVALRAKQKPVLESEHVSEQQGPSGSMQLERKPERTEQPELVEHPEPVEHHESVVHEAELPGQYDHDLEPTEQYGPEQQSLLGQQTTSQETTVPRKSGRPKLAKPMPQKL